MRIMMEKKRKQELMPQRVQQPQLLDRAPSSTTSATSTNTHHSRIRRRRRMVSSCCCWQHKWISSVAVCLLLLLLAKTTTTVGAFGVLPQRFPTPRPTTASITTSRSARIGWSSSPSQQPPQRRQSGGENNRNNHYPQRDDHYTTSSPRRTFGLHMTTTSTSNSETIKEEESSSTSSASTTTTTIASSYEIIAHLDPDWFDRFVVEPLGHAEQISQGRSVAQIKEQAAVRLRDKKEQEKEKQEKEESSKDSSNISSPVKVETKTSIQEAEFKQEEKSPDNTALVYTTTTALSGKEEGDDNGSLLVELKYDENEKNAASTTTTKNAVTVEKQEPEEPTVAVQTKSSSSNSPKVVPANVSTEDAAALDKSVDDDMKDIDTTEDTGMHKERNRTAVDAVSGGRLVDQGEPVETNKILNNTVGDDAMTLLEGETQSTSDPDTTSSLMVKDMEVLNKRNLVDDSESDGNISLEEGKEKDETSDGSNGPQFTKSSAAPGVITPKSKNYPPSALSRSPRGQTSVLENFVSGVMNQSKPVTGSGTLLSPSPSSEKDKNSMANASSNMQEENALDNMLDSAVSPEGPLPKQQKVTSEPDEVSNIKPTAPTKQAPIRNKESVLDTASNVDTEKKTLETPIVGKPKPMSVSPAKYSDDGATNAKPSVQQPSFKQVEKKPIDDKSSSAKKDLLKDRVVVYKGLFSRPCKKASLERMVKLGYTEGEIVSLLPDTLELISTERIKRPSSGVPAQWKQKDASKELVKIVTTEEANELMRLEESKPSTTSRNPPKPKRKENSPAPKPKAARPRSREDDMKIDNEMPSRGARRQKRRQQQRFEEEDDDNISVDSTEPAIKAERRRRSRERTATFDDGSPKPMYSGRPPQNAMSTRRRKGDPPASNSIWPDMDTFRNLLRSEADFRLQILGDEWADVVKEETAWRHDVYSSWLWMLHNGIGNPIVESRSDRYRRIKQSQARRDESRDMKKRRERR